MLKEKLVYIGQLDTYERGSEIAKKLLGISTNDTAIFRITDETGSSSGKWLEEQQFIEGGEDKDHKILNVEVDGSMISTREDSWREVKLGRIFKTKKAQVSEDERYMSKSEYVPHLGGHKEFRSKMDNLIATREKAKTELVFINDGAVWIENWINEKYPQAKQILDFFHAMIHIGAFLDTIYGQGEEKKNMIEYWGHILKNKGVVELKKHIRKEQCKTNKQREAKKKLRKYIDKNGYRMDYPSYLSEGYIIGSGAIESAHRTVIQRRMKLSGQRWSLQGAQNMLDLRAVSMSGHWDWVEQHFRKPAA